MRVEDVRIFLPKYEPRPPLLHMPPQVRNRLSDPYMGEVGDGAFRWCACRVFLVYLPKGVDVFSIAQPDAETHPVRLIKCTGITRGYFHKNHQRVALNRLSVAVAGGHLCCTIDDPTPMDGFDLARRFGLNPHPVDYQKVQNIERALARRGKKFDVERPKKSAATALADRLAKLL